MDTLPLNNKKEVHVHREAVGFEFDPSKRSFSGFASGSGAVPIGALVVISGIAAWKCPILLPYLLTAVFIVISLFLLLKRGAHPRVLVSRDTLSFEGIDGKDSEAFLINLSKIWTGKMRTGVILPEPAGRVDKKTGKMIPFQEGEKDRITQEQKEIERKIIEEVNRVASE